MTAFAMVASAIMRHKQESGFLAAYTRTRHQEAGHPMDFDQDIITIRPESASQTQQKLAYFNGISGKTAGTKGLSMSRVVIPPGARSEAHVHIRFETAIYVLQGKVETRYGKSLENVTINQAGDFVFIPPGLPHLARNLSEQEPAIAIVARNDPNEQEDVQGYSIGDLQPGIG